MEARRLMGGLLASLKWAGWEVAGVMDIARQQEDKAIFLLRQAASHPQPQKQGAVCQMVDWACLSFHEADKIRSVLIVLVDVKNKNHGQKVLIFW